MEMVPSAKRKGCFMRVIVSAVMMVLSGVLPAFSATVYLKDGSSLKARQVWREKGKVVVLVNNQSITSFSPEEVNLKKTFPPGKNRAKPVKKVVSGNDSEPVVKGVEAEVSKPEPEQKKAVRGFKLPSLSIPDKLPEREIPKGSDEGVLRKQKRELNERLNE